MFNQEGTFPVVIKEAFVTDPVYDGSVFEIAVEVEREETGEKDTWLGSLSSNYGRGNFSHMTQTEITMKKLKELGFEGADLAKLESLKGVKTTATIKATVKDNKTYYNISYLGGGRSLQKIDVSKIAQANAEIQALVGGNTGNTQPQANPFLS